MFILKSNVERLYYNILPILRVFNRLRADYNFIWAIKTVSNRLRPDSRSSSICIQNEVWGPVSPDPRRKSLLILYIATEISEYAVFLEGGALKGLSPYK